MASKLLGHPALPRPMLYQHEIDTLTHLTYADCFGCFFSSSQAPSTNDRNLASVNCGPTNVPEYKNVKAAISSSPGTFFIASAF
ncbi:unnamed protein product [Haemonchus placei]|uniref:Uncharacterized protein n=1 Tax=Haemonchus placei TaxID=6290 RepID=A0A0N4WRC2_HAEPC|nr:unnamed protein product [Haemonchus placei]